MNTIENIFTQTTTTQILNENGMHLLKDSWCLWGRLPNNNTNWSIDSYVKIHTFNTVEEAIALSETLVMSDVIVKYCMLFLMRDGIQPLYEDTKNINGGYFSYKVSNKIVLDSWKNLTYCVVGETVSRVEEFNRCVNGITISPKKNFCIIKLWMTNQDWQDPNIVSKNVPGINPIGCNFGQHEAK
jgi:hypothetical protein